MVSREKEIRSRDCWEIWKVEGGERRHCLVVVEAVKAAV